jgi:AcrR family transcriptional regulator
VTAEPTNARSRRTRAALLDAARALLEREGPEALTMGRIAERAGVSRRAVYLHVDSRVDLLLALFDHVSEIEGLVASLQRVDDAPDAGAALNAWATHVATFHPRVLAVDTALRRVRDTDPDAAAHVARVDDDQLAACRRVADRLAADGVLADGWPPPRAAELLWSLLAPDHLTRLLHDRGWTPSEYADRLAAVLRGALLWPDAPSARASATRRQPSR